MSQIAIIDYGVGNLKSVSNAFSYLGCPSYIASRPEELEQADAVILPGVGAFPDAAQKLRESAMADAVLRQGQKKPVMGICLGMQLLLKFGEEVRRCEGLGVVQGGILKIPTQKKLPHIGWNSLRFQHDAPIFRGLEDGGYVYFVHSYSAQMVEDGQVIATTEYGGQVVAAVRQGNFYGCQFHPEKSGELGLTILRNFAQLNLG